jgi:O-antigen ligase
MSFLGEKIEGLLIAAFLIISFGLFWPPDLYFAKGETLAGESSPYHFAAFVVLTALLAIGGLARREQLPRLVLSGWPFLALGAFAMLSAYWSDAPELTIRRSVTFTETTLFAIYLLARYDLPEFIALIERIFLFGAVASIVMMIAAPNLAYAHNYTHVDSWRGAYADKNTLGAVATLAIMTSVYAFRHRYGPRWVAVSCFVLNLALLHFADAKTPVVGLIAACYAALLVNQLQRRTASGLLFGFLLLVIGLASVAFVTLDYSDVMAALNRSPTLSSRTKIWDLALMYIGRRPWLGYGYGSFFRVGGLEASQLQKIMDWDVPTVHNAWLEQALGLGWIGVSLIGLVCLISFRRIGRAMRLPAPNHAAFCAALLTALLMETLTESNFLTAADFVWVLFVVPGVYLGAAVSARDLRSHLPTSPIRAPATADALLAARRLRLQT